MGIASSEIRQRALASFKSQKGTQAEIAAHYGISARTLQRWIDQHARTGSTAPRRRGHRKAAFAGDELKKLDTFIAENPDATLEELRVLTGKRCSIMSVQRAIVRLGYSLKKNAVGQRTKPS